MSTLVRAATALMGLIVMSAGAVLHAQEASPRPLPTGTASDSVPLWPGLGDHHHAITTRAPAAQQYFDQGLRLAYAFNHPDAVRSFRQAQRIDPECAMCFWGEALVLGPNINMPLDSAAEQQAHAALLRAQALSVRSSAKERAYIRALAVRYAARSPGLRKSRDTAYARAMAGVMRRYPTDADAAVLYAEAEMLLGPWDYWLPGRRAKPHGARALAALHPVVRAYPRHAGACHFYIHAVEAAFPERAIPCAERLPSLMPGAGHVVHMPSHVYIRVGRYADAIARNVHALHADDEHLEEMPADGVYRLALHPHNAHFLAFAASMIGRAEETMNAALQTRAKVDTSMMRAPGLGALQHYYVLPTFARVRFERWNEILAEASPPEDLPYPRAVHHYARAKAFAARNERLQAERELDAVRRLRKDERVKTVTIWEINPASALLEIAELTAEADILVLAGKRAAALVMLQRAVDREDALTYDEPPPWHVPVRQQYGALLLKMGRAAAAERVFRQDLERHPENGWSLAGLLASERAQGKVRAAAATAARLERAWSTADIPKPTFDTPR